MMKTIYMLSFCALLLAGCSEKEAAENAETSRIVLGVDPLSGEATKAAVDEWDDTDVNIAYAYAPEMQFLNALTVTVSDNAGQNIDTGMEYPVGGSAVSFIGYYPVSAPVGLGEVSYDISKGNVDVMMSNKVSGTKASPIASTSTINFEHKLTRVTFLMICKPGESYPDLIYGVQATPSTSEMLNTWVTLDLNAGNEIFKIPGTVFSGNATGSVVPLNESDPLVFDLMIQPNVPVTLKVKTETEEKSITISSDPSGIWTDLTTNSGGEAGKRYTVKLTFSGVAIIGQDIEVTSWEEGSIVAGGGAPTWW